ncbi:MAG: hypothetical protein LBU55_01135, partial [Elusimicrobiota bacterium]|nr:hypothetical protein [Elusimicrobiota bacterium]
MSKLSGCVKKNFGVAEFFKAFISAVVLSISSLSYVRVISIILVNAMLLSFVYGEGLSMVLGGVRESGKFNQIFKDFALPYTYGSITNARDSGSDSVVVLVQDLHMHSGVQGNISKIIGAFDEKYGVK